MVKVLLTVILVGPGFASAMDLSKSHNCLMQVRAVSGRATNSYAFLLKHGDVAYIVNAAKLLKVTKPTASEIADGPVNFVSRSGYKSYAGIYNGNVIKYAGSKNGIAELHIEESAVSDQVLAEMVRDDIDAALKLKDVNAKSAKDRIYRACKGLAKLDLPEDWKQSRSDSGGIREGGGIWEDILGGPAPDTAR